MTWSVPLNWESNVRSAVLLDLAGAMIKHQVIDLLFKCPCQVYCGVCNVPQERPTFFHKHISYTAVYPWELVAEWFGRLPWTQTVVVSIPRRHIPRYFSVGIFAACAGVDLCCVSFNCNTGLENCSLFHIQYIQLAFVSSNRSSLCLLALVQDT